MEKSIKIVVFADGLKVCELINKIVITHICWNTIK
jgi:hypothetical protein